MELRDPQDTVHVHLAEETVGEKTVGEAPVSEVAGEARLPEKPGARDPLR
ncbi:MULTISPECIES: hypothetical protein [unclassified Crossiella]|nr:MULTISPECIES: hypothetical protein [unclassified Crossiella]MCK2241470.1 hypothetical protein [Crossiella sp. S99.2]MCK2255658.1 hypothetical protein [Crossiella sp. S99.1]